MKRIIVGISGASAVNLGFRFLEILPLEIEKYCVISKGAKEVFKCFCLPQSNLTTSWKF